MHPPRLAPSIIDFIFSTIVMYLPPHFAESRPEVLHQLIRDYPLAALVTQGAAGLDANHLPLQLSQGLDGAVTLCGHLARANPLVAELAAGGEALAIFQGPQAYVTPAWYPTKAEHGRVVPTWNYAVVHAHGMARVIDDAAWVRAQVEALTEAQEAGRPTPWAVADAPADYLERLGQAIVGIELRVLRLEGKWKVSQNQPPLNQSGVVRGLRDDGQEALAALVAAYGDRGQT